MRTSAKRNELRSFKPILRFLLMRLLTVFGAGMTILLCTGWAAAQVNVSIYQNCNGTSCNGNTSGGGAPYSGLVGSFSSSDILFGTDTNFNWHPFQQQAFGADLTGFFSVSTDGTYTFVINSDDGSEFLIDGKTVIDNGGSHGASPVSASVMLTAGVHPFEIQHFEEGTGGSGVDLFPPCGVNYSDSAGASPVKLVKILPSTGLDQSGKLLTMGGQADANWTVDQATGGTAPAQFVASNSPDYFSGWFPNGPTSQWIARNASNSNNGPAPYSWHLTFDTTGLDLSKIELMGSWAIDDQGTLNLNGNQLSSLPNGAWGSLTGFAVGPGSTFFVSGSNDLSMTLTATDNFLEGARLQGCLIIPPASATATATPSATPSATPVKTATPTIAATATPTIAPTPTPSPTATPSPTPTPAPVAVTLKISPKQLSFGKVTVNASKSHKPPITVSNPKGNKKHPGITVFMEGTNMVSEYTITNHCNGPLAAGASCTIDVTFMPTKVGTAAGNLQIMDNATGAPQMVKLVGIGK